MDKIPKQIKIVIGKITARKSPARSSVCSGVSPLAAPQFNNRLEFSAKSEAIPASHGPMEQPTSPNRASMANIAVPPFGKVAEDRDSTPGQNRLTEKPVSAQAASDKIGLDANTAVV